MVKPILVASLVVVGALIAYGQAAASDSTAALIATDRPEVTDSRQLTKTWDAFVEYAGDFPGQGGPRHVLHFGSAYKPTPHQQIDLLGLSSAAVDHFIGVGYSFRLQAVRR